MFRATVLSVALSVAVGPSALLSCNAWCDPHVAASNGCHAANAASTGVTSGDSCQDLVEGTGVPLKEDARYAPAPDAGASVMAAGVLFAATVSHMLPVWSRGQAPSALKRPQTTPLRI